ncbi:MAG: amidohydrolase family protein [Sphingomonadaceae bacterium]|mgnify:CR=1 FL=1
MLDVLIKGGSLIDGLGGDARRADIGIKDGRIAEIASAISTPAKGMLDATGAIVTPGFIDVHTHYDGQVCWDDQLDPSAGHGVTTVVMGNCGVGFAPAPPGGELELIEVMEGVEDIPGTALYEGVPWGAWESFPEYMDYLDTRRYALDISAQIPHAALRNYVMGERGRANDPATPEDMSRMAALVEDALKAGAIGFSTSRTIGHRTMSGDPIPGTYAADEEVLELAAAMRRAGRGVFELIPGGTVGDLAVLGGEHTTLEQEVALMDKVSHVSQRPVTFTLVQNADHRSAWRDVLSRIEQCNANGARLYPQVASRPIGLVTNIQTYHMFQRRETYMKLARLPLPERLAEMRKPDVRAAILAERDISSGKAGMMANANTIFRRAAPNLYELDLPIDYEPTSDKRFGERAKAAGQTVEEFMYDFLIGNDGRNFAIQLGANYYNGNFDVIRDMLLHPDTITGLSDAGAHVNLIFDGVAPTYQMIHWARDRTRGEGLPLEFIIAKQTKRNADLYGMTDRGSLEVGKRADINVIDFERLSLGELEVRSDLPAGGTRILQPASGYLATFVNGVQTRKDDVDTGARPGRLVRS